MEHNNKMYKKLNELHLDPSPAAWNRIDTNLRKKKRSNPVILYAAIAASFLLVLSIAMIRFSESNSFEIKLADNADMKENYELYNIEYSEMLAKAYNANIN